ncbi:MAG: mycofactocin precursor MftA [Halobacteriales archaeon]
MSQTAAEDGEPADASGAAEPAIEEDLIEEELRIDGICGVY